MASPSPISNARQMVSAASPGQFVKAKKGPPPPPVGDGGPLLPVFQRENGPRTALGGAQQCARFKRPPAGSRLAEEKQVTPLGGPI